MRITVTTYIYEDGDPARRKETNFENVDLPSEESLLIRGRKAGNASHTPIINIEHDSITAFSLKKDGRNGGMVFENITGQTIPLRYDVESGQSPCPRKLVKAGGKENFLVQQFPIDVTFNKVDAGVTIKIIEGQPRSGKYKTVIFAGKPRVENE